MTNSFIMRVPGLRRPGGWLFAVMLACLWPHEMAYASESPTCGQWLERVVQDPKPASAKESALAKASVEAEVAALFASPRQSDPWNVASLTEADKLNAIQCLLAEENDLRPGAFSGVTRLDVSQLFAPTRANLAALYAISYVYSGRFNHASAIALGGDNASHSDAHHLYVTNASAVHKAYRAYRIWFSRVRQMGLAGAQQAGLQPLDGTGLHWY